MRPETRWKKISRCMRHLPQDILERERESLSVCVRVPGCWLARTSSCSRCATPVPACDHLRTQSPETCRRPSPPSQSCPTSRHAPPAQRCVPRSEPLQPPVPRFAVHHDAPPREPHYAPPQEPRYAPRRWPSQPRAPSPPPAVPRAPPARAAAPQPRRAHPRRCAASLHRTQKTSSGEARSRRRPRARRRRPPQPVRGSLAGPPPTLRLESRADRSGRTRGAGPPRLEQRCWCPGRRVCAGGVSERVRQESLPAAHLTPLVAVERQVGHTLLAAVNQRTVQPRQKVWPHGSATGWWEISSGSGEAESARAPAPL